MVKNGLICHFLPCNNVEIRCKKFKDYFYIVRSLKFYIKHSHLGSPEIYLRLLQRSNLKKNAHNTLTSRSVNQHRSLPATGILSTHIHHRFTKLHNNLPINWIYFQELKDTRSNYLLKLNSLFFVRECFSTMNMLLGVLHHMFTLQSCFGPQLLYLVWFVTIRNLNSKEQEKIYFKILHD